MRIDLDLIMNDLGDGDDVGNDRRVPAGASAAVPCSSVSSFLGGKFAMGYNPTSFSAEWGLRVLREEQGATKDKTVRTEIRTRATLSRRLSPFSLTIEPWNYG